MTEHHTPTGRDELAARLSDLGGTETGGAVLVRSLEEELAEWGTSPEAESGLLAFLGDEPVATAT